MPAFGAPGVIVREAVVAAPVELDPYSGVEVGRSFRHLVQELPPDTSGSAPAAAFVGPLPSQLIPALLSI